MTKIYEGCGDYKLHLYSGRTLILSDEEICEICEDKIDREFFDEQVSALNFIDSITSDTYAILEELKEETSEEFKEKMLSDLQDKQQKIDEIISVARQQRVAI